MTDKNPFQCALSEGFAQWLAQSGGSIAVSTYQAGKVLLAGWNGRQVSLLIRNFDKPMGLALNGDRLALATRHELTLFGNARNLAGSYRRDAVYDALFLPRSSHYTGDVNVHDVAFGADGLWVVVTRFGCLALITDDFSFVPKWRPRFVSELVPEDRCHLNGLAMRGSRPWMVTVLGETDVPGGWRPGKATGGAIIDVASGETLIRGLSMPHSPRHADGRLWFLNSGTGELCLADTAAGRFDAVCGLPGYVRGLEVIGGYALVGLSKIREQHIFGGLPVQSRYPNLLSGVAVVDLQRGESVGMLEFTSGCSEMFDVRFLPGVLQANILGADKDAAKEGVTTPEGEFWMRAENFSPVDEGTGTS
jgi:uncharacterized protein (TIGR03032 family)